MSKALEIELLDTESALRPDRAAELQALAGKILADGREVVVVPMIFTFRVCIGPADAAMYDEAYCYDHLEDAVHAISEWHGDGEPQGWKRHVGSGRRRPGGDPALEYIEH